MSDDTNRAAPASPPTAAPPAASTPEDLRHLRALVTDDSWRGAVHPFTEIRFRALGWTNEAGEWTAAGQAAIRVATMKEGAATTSNAAEVAIELGKMCAEAKANANHSRSMGMGDEADADDYEAEARVLERAVQLLLAVAPDSQGVAPTDTERLRDYCHATFNGGYTRGDNHEALQRAFHHGMDTVCNVLKKNPAPASVASEGTTPTRSKGWFHATLHVMVAEGRTQAFNELLAAYDTALRAAEDATRESRKQIENAARFALAIERLDSENAALRSRLDVMTDAAIRARLRRAAAPEGDAQT